jgi:hypothetical protein
LASPQAAFKMFKTMLLCQHEAEPKIIGRFLISTHQNNLKILKKY